MRRAHIPDRSGAPGSLQGTFLSRQNREALLRAGSMTLPGLYALAEDFNKDSKKSNLLKTHGISFKEARRLLAKSLNVMCPSCRAGKLADPQPVHARPAARRDQEEPGSAELPLRSLLEGWAAPGQSLPGPQKRLTEAGVPPPTYPFPCTVVQDGMKALAQAATEQTQVPQESDRLRLLKPIFEAKISGYFLVDPEKQFLGLRDLERKYCKGLASWKHTTVASLVDVKYSSEKRFVERQGVPDGISPPLVCKSSVIYPLIDFQEGGYNLKWNV